MVRYIGFISVYISIVLLKCSALKCYVGDDFGARFTNGSTFVLTDCYVQDGTYGYCAKQTGSWSFLYIFKLLFKKMKFFFLSNI